MAVKARISNIKKWSVKTGVSNGGTRDHRKLIGRDANDQHPVSAITGLQAIIEQFRSHKHNYNDLDNKPVIPTSLPANGGNADTVDGKHATDFAPAGYGLGDSKYFAPETIDTIYSPGWYRTSNITVDGNPFSYVYMRVDAYNTTSCIQTLHVVSETGLTLQRRLHNSVWQPWEWANPPMNANVEYRTTERFDGRPVYRQRFIWTNPGSIGSANGVDDIKIDNGISNIRQIVRCDTTVGTYKIPYIASGGGLTAVCDVTASQITMRTVNMTWSSSRDWIFDLAYTKY